MIRVARVSLLRMLARRAPAGRQGRAGADAGPGAARRRRLIQYGLIRQRRQAAALASSKLACPHRQVQAGGQDCCTCSRQVQTYLPLIRSGASRRAGLLHLLSPGTNLLAPHKVRCKQAGRTVAPALARYKHACPPAPGTSMLAPRRQVQACGQDCCTFSR